MIDNIKILLGDTAANYTDAQINLCYEMSVAEVEAYCNRAVDKELELTAQKITIIKLNRLNSEGLQSQSYSGITETYLNDYPADILAILNRKRKIKIM